MANHLEQFFGAFHDAVKQNDGLAAAKLIAADGAGHPGPRGAMTAFAAGIDLARACAENVPEAYAALVEAHLRCACACAGAGAGAGAGAAFSHQHAAYKAFLLVWTTETGWLVPVMCQMSLDVRVLALDADRAADAADRTAIGGGGALASARRAAGGVEGFEANACLKKSKLVLESAIQRCNMEKRVKATDPRSKKRGALYLIVQLFKIYFRLNTLALCKKCMNIVESRTFPPFDSFPLSHRVTYRYYTGRLAMFDTDYAKAAAHLSFVFTHLPAGDDANRKRVLAFLVPVKLLRGLLPGDALLARYGLGAPYAPLCRAVRNGDVRAFNASLRAHEALFIRQGVYLVLAQLRLLVCRSLCRAVHAAHGAAVAARGAGRANVVPVALFVKALRWAGGFEDALGGEPDAKRARVEGGGDGGGGGGAGAGAGDPTQDELDEAECLLTNLIYKKYLRGYISHAKMMLVTAQDNVFPGLNKKK